MKLAESKLRSIIKEELKKLKSYAYVTPVDNLANSEAFAKLIDDVVSTFEAQNLKFAQHSYGAVDNIEKWKLEIDKAANELHEKLSEDLSYEIQLLIEKTVSEIAKDLHDSFYASDDDIDDEPISSRQY